MAGLAGLPYFIQYQGALQQQAAEKQQQQLQLMQFQQAQQDRQRQQAAQAAAGNALPQLFAGGQPAAIPAPPPPQPPAPGQPSQPAPQMAGGGAPLPQGPIPGQVNRPPLPPGGVQGAMTPPFRPMPTTPPVAAQAPQGAIPAPPQPQQAAPTAPQGGPLTFENAIKVLRDQGLEGADLFAGLQQLAPILDTQAKAQAAAAQQQFTHQLQLSQLQERYDALKQRSEDQAANREDRAAAREEARATRLQIAGMNNAIKMQALNFRVQGNPDQALSKDDLSFMAKQYIAAPDPSIFTNLGRGAQGAKNVVALRTAIQEEAKNQGLSPEDLAAKGIAVGGEKAAARTAGTRATNIGLAAAEAQQTFPLVRQASADLARTQFVPANRALQAAQSNTGDPKVIAFGTALNTAINAYARAISPTGTPTVSDKEHARAILSTANTPEQVEAALDVMEKEMAAARAAPEEVQRAQKERIAGPSRQAAGPVRINSDADYSALPSGAQFIAPDGTTRRKP